MSDPIAVDDAVLVGDEVNPYWHVFNWQQLGVSSLANAFGYGSGAPIIIKGAPNEKIFVAYQTGTKGATGLVYQQSNDRGTVWLGEVQIDDEQDKFVAAVIDPDTSNIHLVYFQIGEPTLSTVGSIYYRVLAYSGGVWAVGAEKITVAGSVIYGYSNASLGVRNGYLLALLYGRTSSTTRYLYSAKAKGAWDLFTNVDLDIEQTMIPSTEVRVDLTHDVVNNVWYITTEQGGTFVMWSTSWAPVGEITPANQCSWYGATTPQFDTVYNPTTGTVGIVQENGGAIEFRTFNPNTGLVSTATVIEADDGFWPSIMVDEGGRFVIAYTKTASGDTRYLRVARSDDWTTLHTLATDSAAEAWGGTHIAQTCAGVDGLVIAWCDTEDNDADTNYRVFCGILNQAVFKNADDTILANEFTSMQHPVADAVALIETLHAAEPINVDDTVALAETIATWMRVYETILVAEDYEGTLHVADNVTFSDVFHLNIPVADTGSMVDAVSFVFKVVVADTINAADAVVKLGQFIADTLLATEALGALGVEVADGILAGDVVIRDVLVAETAHADDALVINQALADGATATELIEMIYEIIESVSFSEEVRAGVVALDAVHADDIILQLSVHLDDEVNVADSAVKGVDHRVNIQLHLHKGAARLLMEGGE